MTLSRVELALVITGLAQSAAVFLEGGALEGDALMVAMRELRVRCEAEYARLAREENAPRPRARFAAADVALWLRERFPDSDAVFVSLSSPNGFMTYELALTPAQLSRLESVIIEIQREREGGGKCEP